MLLCLAGLVGACSSGDTGGGNQDLRGSAPTVGPETEPGGAVEDTAAPVRFGDAARRLQEMGTLSYLIARPNNGECEVLASQDAGTLLPLASVFKLYVLGALVDAVRSGGITWDDPVPIRDEFDSLGGPTAQEEPGTELSVRELATRMISVSDNTATDHLMDFVGRPAIEQIQSAMGHSQPTVNVPLPTTREVTILKLSGDADLTERYSTANADERRVILDDEVASRPFPTSEQTQYPVFGYQHSIGWFGTARDACRALDWLAEDDEALAILTDEPLSPNADLWPTLGFKGGSDDGVATAAWWMQTGDGQAYTAVVSLVNETNELDLGAVIELMVTLRDETLVFSAE